MRCWTTLLLSLLLLLLGCQQPGPPPEQPSPASSPTRTEPSPELTPEETPSPLETPVAITSGKPPGKRVDPFNRKPRPPKKGPQKKSKLPKDAYVELVALTGSAESRETVKRFGSETEEIFLTVRVRGVEDGKVLKTIWFPTASPRSRTSDSATTSAAAETFSLERPQRGWFDGDYTVQVEVDGEVLGETVFTIEPARADNPLEYATLTESIENPNHSVRFGRELEGIHLVVGTGTLKPGTPVRAVWRASQVPRFSRDEVINSMTVRAGGPEEDILFSFKPPSGGYHAGHYSVALFVDRHQVQELSFDIE